MPTGPYTAYFRRANSFLPRHILFSDAQDAFFASIVIKCFSIESDWTEQTALTAESCFFHATTRGLAVSEQAFYYRKRMLYLSPHLGLRMPDLFQWPVFDRTF